jgi:N-formylglutamate deformylase
MTLPYKITQHKGEELPVIISVPHCGVLFPEELKAEYKSEMIASPDDTDWFVDQLYGFAPEMGMTMISAVFNRWVIDLNRDPQSKPLYHDGRIITALCPVTDFLGNPIYQDERKQVNDEDLAARLKIYYWPYHDQIQKLIEEKKKKFGAVLLWDCHSIRQQVPTIFNEKFPDLILGSADETSAAAELVNTALHRLQTGPYIISHNHPFKGGYITRAYGKPLTNVHALQLEMTKVNYMDDQETAYHPERAQRMQVLLTSALDALSKKISASPNH